LSAAFACPARATGLDHENRSRPLPRTIASAMPSTGAIDHHVREMLVALLEERLHLAA
jgi:hypothetical protein